MANQIVVIIPYYKARFFRETLGSFANQTCKQFRLFVADDSSPESPVDILNEFSSKLTITYHRFDVNLGRKSLTGQWNRCVSMTEDPWIWLFSDDDIAEPQCIELLLAELDHAPLADVYRFEKTIIDDDGKVIEQRIVVPAIETSEEMILSRFRDGRSITIPEHVFSRDAFEREGGFVDFPLAWFADDASWAAMATVTGIKTIHGAAISWRNGNCNLSARNRDIPAKVAAFVSYLKWLRRFARRKDFEEQLIKTSRRWIPVGFSWLGDFVPLRTIVSFWRSYSSVHRRTRVGIAYKNAESQ